MDAIAVTAVASVPALTYHVLPLVACSMRGLLWHFSCVEGLPFVLKGARDIIQLKIHRIGAEVCFRSGVRELPTCDLLHALN